MARQRERGLVSGLGGSQRGYSPAVRLLVLLPFVLAAALASCSIGVGNTGPGITVPVQVVTGESGATLILLPVSIGNSGPYTFALDTGASSSLVDRAIAQRDGLQQIGTPQPISGVGGNEQAYPVRIQSWHTGSLRLPSVTAAAANIATLRHESKLQGLVGSDVWRQFGSVDINYSASTITVPRQIVSSTGEEAVLHVTHHARSLSPLRARLQDERRILGLARPV